MAKTFRPWDVEQQWLFPPSVLDLVPAGHAAHFVRELVRAELDLSAILETYGEERGYPPFHPAMMTALLLYAFSQGVYSSRRIARACEERVDFMAVTAMQKPDFRTVAKFRKRHLAALGELFKQVLKLCQRAGLVKLGHVSLDGTKMRANASKHKAMSYERMQKKEAELQAEIDRWFAEADAADTAEDAEFGDDRRGDELPDWVTNKQKRLEKIREAKAALEAEAKQKAEAKKAEQDANSSEPKNEQKKEEEPKPEPKAQRNFTDPESRIMKTSSGFEQCYNAQAVVDSDSQVVVACNVTNRATDVKELPGMVAQIKANTGHQAKELSADAGYCSDDNLKELTRRHINAYVATGRQKHGEASAAGKARRKGSERVQAMRLKLKRAGYRSRYRLRKQTVEPVFGLVKHARGFRQFLLRGLDRVREEWSLLCTAHNLLKLAAARG